MSVLLMSQAFKSALPSTKKLVLLALCDCANDQGECYPSIPTLMEKCSVGERTAQEAIAMLERDGFIRREFRTGRSTVYWITDPRTWRTPAAAAPPRVAHPTPAVSAPPPPQQPHPTPAAAAPITINEPNTKTKPKTAHASVPVSVLVDAGFDEVTAREFIDTKASRKAPLTARAWRDHLTEARKAGWSPVAAAEKVMAKTWKGFEAKYVADERPSFQSAKAAENGKWTKGTSLDPNFIDMENDCGTQFALR